MSTVHHNLSSVGPFVPFGILYDKLPTVAELGPNYKYDVKAAKDLLAAAGVTNLEVQLDWYESGTNQAISSVFQQSAAEAGVKINLNKSPDLVAHGNAQRSREWKDLIVFAKSASFNDAQATLAFLQKGSGQNYSETDDPALNAINDKLITASGAARKAATQELWDRHLDQIYEIMFPQQFDLYWWNLRMHNWRNTAFSANVGHGEIATEAVWVSA
jgi:ABC-type transport system substrate-binding protein